MHRPCHLCRKPYDLHIQLTTLLACPRRDMYQVEVNIYRPMTNLEYLEWCYDMKRKGEINV